MKALGKQENRSQDYFMLLYVSVTIALPRRVPAEVQVENFVFYSRFVKCAY